MPIKPHRFFGIVLTVMTVGTWLSGVLHALGSCNAPSDVQMCNAHIYLGTIFIVIGLINGYYSAESSAKAEMCLITLGGVSELIGEGVGDLILNAIDSAMFPWDSMAKMAHLTTAAVWVLCAIVGWVLAVRKPSTLQRGVSLTLGCFFHLIFMFLHSGHASTLTETGHLIHELALIPVIIARPTGRLPRITSYMLTISGFAFIFAADPITRDVSEIAPFTYVVIIIMSATAFHFVHGYIRKYILRKDPSETMLERTGCAQPVWVFLGCFSRLFCCCPGLSVSDESPFVSNGAPKYEHLPTNLSVEDESKVPDIDEDVTSPPSAV